MKTRRVLLKLSGEALAGPKKTGFDEDTVKEVARCKEVFDAIYTLAEDLQSRLEG